MASQPSDREDGEDGDEAAVSKSDLGLDAELDRAIPASEAEAFLIGVSGKQAGRVFALSHNTVFVGRAPESDVFVADPSVSARHARIINGSQGFEIEDLDSTNGTFIGEQRVTRARLMNGDRITVGQVEFNFLFDRSTDSTIAVFSPDGRPIQPAGGALVRMPAPYFAPRPAARLTPPFVERGDRGERGGEEEGPSLAETIGRMIKAYRFISRYFTLIFALLGAGIGLGLLSITIVPPVAKAICAVKLQPQVKSNPMDPQARNDEDTVQFFAGAERAFTAPGLISVTFKKLLGREPTESEVLSIAGRLHFDPLPDHVYTATYKDRVFGGGIPKPVEFLKTHLDTYVQTEIDKALRVFTAQADFLRNQMQSVEKEMGLIGAERTKFREKNSDRLPEEAALAQTSRFTLETHRAELVGQIRRLQGELEAGRQTLAADVPVNQTRFQASQVYRDSLAEIKGKLSALYAQGLADGHPDVVRLNNEKARVEALIEKEMHADTTKMDRQSNTGLQELRSRVELLQAQLGAARGDLADTDKTLADIKHVVGDLPRVEERVQQLNHTQEATTHLHSQLFEQLKKAELQLSLERVSAESRYDIVMPPQLEKNGKVKTAGIRAAIGMAIGLLLSAMIIVALEGRRIVNQTLATLDQNSHAGFPRR
jgi:hypothetical protein